MDKPNIAIATRLAALTVFVCVTAVTAQAWSQTCTATPGTYTENFKTTAYYDIANSSVQGWGTNNGVKLQYKAGAFPSPNPNTWNFGERIYAITTGDYLGDGNTEIIAMALSSTGGCTLDYFTPTSTLVAPTKVGSVGTCTTPAFIGTSMTTGDVNGDGKMDIVYAWTTNPLTSGLVAGAILLVNTTVSSTTPSFSATDITSLFTGQAVAWHATGSSSPIALSDWDGDGRADLIAMSSYGTVNTVYEWQAAAGATPGFLTTPNVLVPTIGLQTPIASSGQAATGGYGCDGSVTVSKGATGIAVADLNNDGANDLFITSASETNAYRYFRNLDGSLTRGTNVSGFGAAMLYADDIDNNGVADIMAVPSGNDCQGFNSASASPSSIWLKLYNVGNTTDRLFSLQLPAGSIQWSGILDMDHDGTPDIIAGKLNGMGMATAYRNTPLTTAYAGGAAYALTGSAQSKTLVTLNANTTGVVAVTVTGFNTTAASGGNIALLVTNNGGQTWDQLTPAELAGTQHNFAYFGADLRYKIKFSETAYNFPTSPQTLYVPAANVTPIVTGLNMTYLTVPQGVYSRSSLAEGAWGTAPNNKDYLYSAAFQYPGFTGYLYAYDIKSLTAGTAGNSNLQAITNNSNVSVGTAWEAGSLLQSQSATSRTIYTAYPVKYIPGPSYSDLTIDGKMSFSASQLTSPTTSPNLLSMMNLNPTNATAVFNFLIGGMGNPNGTKFYDPGHSSPVFVGAPSGDATYMGSSYSTFATGAAASRLPIVLIGANDGMLHAFNAATGAEVWAFVPNNLLSSLANQVGINPNSGAFYYKHQAFVDGSIQVSDVLTGGVWKTVAVVGEGQGQGSKGNHFYFAVDITDTSNPIPLWEFSDIADNVPTVCDGNPCSYSCVTTCVNSGVVTANLPNDSYFQIGLTQGAVEAENYDTVLNASGTDDYWTLKNSGVPATTASGGAVMSPIGSSTPCPTGTVTAAGLCTQMTYRFNVSTFGGINYYPWFRMYTTSSSIKQIAWGVDGALNQTLTASSLPNNAWAWIAGSGVNLSVGDHTLTVYMSQTTINVDQVAFTLSAVTPPAIGSNAAPTTPMIEQYWVCGSPACSTSCVSDPNNSEWPQCGVGSGNKCCQFSASQFYCSPASTSCTAPPTSMGQSWSKPAIGRMNWTGNPGGKYVAWFGSGYNDRALFNVGRTIYGVDAYTGYPIGQWTAPDVTYNALNPNIDNTMPGSPSLVDVDNDGYIDRLYIGDLMGRMWKLNTNPAISLNGNQAMSNPNVYLMCTVFDAGNPNQTGDARQWAPIITRPATAVFNGNVVNVYFGTGGDDRAPVLTQPYKFYSVRDLDTMSTCAATPRSAVNFTTANLEWIVGDGMTNTSPPATLSDPNAEGSPGDRYWADPVIVNGDEIYFASLPGSIESVNPCLDLQGSSKVFSYAIQNYTDYSGGAHQAGQTTLGNNLPYLVSSGKIRQAALVRGVTATNTHGTTSAQTAAKNDVFIQSYSNTNGGNGAPTVSRISDQGTQFKAALRVLRWREISL